MLTLPLRQPLTLWSEMPAPLRRPRRSDWADLNMAGRELGCFLEGPVLDEAGNLFVADIPFGRVLRIDPTGQWSLVAEYDGWPNGMKLWQGQLLIADHRRGLVALDRVTGAREILFSAVGRTALLGLNDLTFAPDSTLYLTDQGQSGLHDPRGRVLRRSPDGVVDVVLDSCPSPNGLVVDPASGWLYVAMTRANAVWRVPFVRGEASKVGLAIQLSGGIGPDGLALDPAGNLLVAHPPLGVWQFDADNLPIRLFAAPPGSHVTNLVVAHAGQPQRIYVTDSMNGRILTAALDEAA
jgi:gluconolactonase